MSFGLGERLRYGWTGREYDAETGFSFHRARYYLPTLRRWTQEDPIGYRGSGNLYAYVSGAPLEFRDPTGLVPGRNGGTAAGQLWWADNMPNPMFLSFINKEVDEYAWWLPTHDAWRPRFAGMITFNGIEGDDEVCKVNAECRKAWDEVDNGTRAVTIVYDKDYTGGSIAIYSAATDRWTIRYNPASFDKAAEAAGVNLTDVPTAFAHEFGHIMFSDYYWDLVQRDPQCLPGERYAVDIENRVRAANPGRYTIRTTLARCRSRT